MILTLSKKYAYAEAGLVLAGTLATLAGLAAGLATRLAALAAHHLILASRSHVVATVLAGILARIATVTTSVGHFIFRAAIFFTRVGSLQTFSRPEAVPNLRSGCGAQPALLQNALLPVQRLGFCSHPSS